MNIFEQAERATQARLNSIVIGTGITPDNAAENQDLLNIAYLKTLTSTYRSIIEDLLIKIEIMQEFYEEDMPQVGFKKPE